MSRRKVYEVDLVPTAARAVRYQPLTRVFMTAGYRAPAESACVRLRNRLDGHVRTDDNARSGPAQMHFVERQRKTTRNLSDTMQCKTACSLSGEQVSLSDLAFRFGRLPSCD